MKTVPPQAAIVTMTTKVCCTVVNCVFNEGVTTINSDSCHVNLGVESEPGEDHHI